MHFPVLNLIMKIRIFILLFVVTGYSAMPQSNIVELIQVKMNSRTINKGKYTTMNADIWYQNRDGRMVSHYSSPYNVVVITNNKGEVQLYNIDQNTIGVQ